MHELPKDLTSSLRSYRGSIYNRRHSLQADGDDPIRYSQDLGYKRPRDSLHEKSQAQPLQYDYGQVPQSYEDHIFDDKVSAENDSHDNGHGNDVHPSEQHPQYHQASLTDRPVTRGTASKTHGPAASKTTLFGQGHVADPDPVAKRSANDKTPLTAAQFFELIGIRPPDDSNKYSSLRHRRLEGGLYDRILAQQDSAQWRFRTFGALAYILLGIQLILSALFIILGSIRHLDTHLAISILGAVATVIAGSLALMQGQGLPNRLRQVRDSMRTVAFAVNELYEDFLADRPVYFSDISRVREDYLTVLEEARKNHPDTWNHASDQISNGISKNRSVTVEEDKV